MTEGRLEEVDGVKIFTRGWQLAGETRAVIVSSHGLNAHKWGAVPGRSRPSAMNIRKASYGLIAITCLGLAPAMPIAAANPPGASVVCADLIKWLADTEHSLWIQANTHGWFSARFASGCHWIGKLDSINAQSNVSAFLKPGVPAELTRLALHTAWMSDPAIRDFVGIAENQWDFNAEGAIAGFGSLSAEEYARHLAARAQLLGRL